MDSRTKALHFCCCCDKTRKHPLLEEMQKAASATKKICLYCNGDSVLSQLEGILPFFLVDVVFSLDYHLATKARTAAGHQVLTSTKEIRSYERELPACIQLILLEWHKQRFARSPSKFCLPFEFLPDGCARKKNQQVWAAANLARQVQRIAEPGQSDGIYQIAFHSSASLPWQRHLDEALL